MQDKYISLTLFVLDLDDTIAFYGKFLNFEVSFDSHRSSNKNQERWVMLRKINNPAIRLTLKVAKPDEQELVGKQAGNYYLFNIGSEEIEKEVIRMRNLGLEVEFVSPPYADYAYIKDLYGNKIMITEFHIEDW